MNSGGKERRSYLRQEPVILTVLSVLVVLFFRGGDGTVARL